MRALLELIRLPTVFTAMADVLLGFTLTHGVIAPHWGPFGLLLATTVALYFSGMIFNDVYDVEQDRLERPQRPIPSGRISRRTATVLGLVLQGLGLITASLVGWPSLALAALLVLAIHAYDGLLKRTFVAPLAMGSCRFLNVLLAASHQPDWSAIWGQPQLACALGLGIYIVGVTWFARTEARTSHRLSLLGALGVVDAGIVVLAVLMKSRDGAGDALLPLVFLAFVAVTVNRRMLAAVWQPDSARVRIGVKTLLLSYVMVCATLVYWHVGGGPLPLITAALVIPAVILSRMIAMT